MVGMSAKKLSYSDMVLQAVLNIKDYRKGASRQAVKKYIEDSYKKVVSLPALRSAIKKLVADGVLLQTGQRFKLEQAKRAELRKPAPKPKKKKKKPVKKKTKTKKKKTKKKKPKKKKTKKKTKKKAAKKKRLRKKQPKK